MKIGTNIFALTASRNLSQTSQALARSLQRLSSGQRITSAKDNSVGLSMATRLNAQIRGITQAVENTNQGYSALTIADGAIGEMISILQRIRELAVQAANGTLTTTDRSSINTQIQGLIQEYERITDSTTFANIHLLDGTFNQIDIQIGNSMPSTIDLNINDLSKMKIFEKTIGTGTFKADRTYFGGDGAKTLTTGDLNGDGVLDIISASATDDAVNVLIGNGDGTFKSAITYFGGDGVFSVTTGDLNGDGILDIVSGSFYDDAVNVRLGNGDGTFKSATTYFGGDWVNSVTTRDLNGDGVLDIISGSNTDDAVNVRLGNGDGTFQAATTYFGGDGVTSFTTGDLNGDGVLDIVSGSATDDAVNVLIGNGDGTFQAATTYYGGNLVYSVTTGDLNGDGVLDIISGSNTDDAVNVRLGNGDGTFQAATTYFGGDGVYSVTTGDLNGDGVLDIISGSNADDAVNVLVGNGDGSFKAAISYFGGDSVYSVTTGDLNGDGVLDIVSGSVTDDAANVFIGNAHTVTALSDLNLTSAEKASSALSIIDNALSKLSLERSGVGTAQNRLENVVSNLYTSRETLAQAYSDIMDVDIAMETAELVRNQIMQQAGIAVLSQSNLMQASVLELLR